MRVLYVKRKASDLWIMRIYEGRGLSRKLLRSFVLTDDEMAQFRNMINQAWEEGVEQGKLELWQRES